MKKIILFCLFAVVGFGQVTYNSSKFKNVIYNSTYEKTHGTYALFDTSSLKLYWTTSGKPEMKFFGPTGNTLFYVDSTGSIGTGTFPTYLLKANFGDSLVNYDGYGVTITDNADIKVDTSAIPTDYDMSLRVLKTAFGDSLVNYEGWGVDIIDNDNLHVDSAQVASVYADGLKLLKTAFDDSLNNAHTVTGAWKFSGAVGAIAAGSASLGRTAGDGYLKLTADDGDTLVIYNDGTTGYLKTKGALTLTGAGNEIQWNGSYLAPTTNDARSIGNYLNLWQKGFYSDSLLLGGKAQGATLWWGQSRQLTAADSCGLLTMASGNPVMSMYATDGDNYTQSINTSDQAVFTGASGGYLFDALLRTRDTDTDTLAMNPKGFSATNTNLAGDIAWQLKDGATNLASVDTTGIMTLAGHVVISSLNYKGTQTATFNAGTGDCWFSLAGTGTDTLWVSIDGTNAVPFVGAARVAKH